jgi:hypothetical protein
MTYREQHAEWADRTFGHARLGDERRVERLVAMAARVAERPAGPVTQVFDTSAQREGAFRLLESDAASPDAIRRAAFEATAKSCRKSPRLYVAIDGSSLTLTDRAERRELGRVGTSRPARGLQVMSALAIDERGAALGLLDQRWWARDQPPFLRKGKASRCIGTRYKDKETRHWLDTLTDCDDRLQQNAPDAQAWYQLDRGADCWPVIQLALERELLITIRAAHNRRLLGPEGQKLHLWHEVKRQRVLGRYEVKVPRRGRAPRQAQIALRACRVTIHARVGSHRLQAFTLNVVMAEETGRRQKDRICWVLLTTHPVGTREEAKAVVSAYALRWRIEDFHRAWKRGVCNVEKSQLHSRNAIIKWATILAAVAARALRLAHLLRTTPDAPASTEFTEYEIEACYILRKQRRDRRKTVLLGELLNMIAEMGGFANKYSGKPPGPTVLGRGLERVMIMAKGLQNMAEMR